MKKKHFKLPVNTIILAAVAAIACVAVWRNDAGYAQFALNESLIYGICALAFSLMLGMGGMMTFASISFFGVGAYVVANLSTGRLGPQLDCKWLLLIAPVITAIVGGIVGLPLLRLSGNYFTFATIGVVQVAFCFFNNYQPLFGGYDGISGIKKLAFGSWKVSGDKKWFIVLVIAVFLVVLVMERIRHSRLGRSLAAIRDNEIAAKTLGINVFFTKWCAFTISAAICGFGGALYAMYTRFVAADCFTYANGIPYIIMAMLGGVNSSIGVLVGSILVGMLPEWLRFLKEYMQLIYGAGIILLMIFMPMGLNGIRESIFKRIKKAIQDKKGDKDNGTDAAA